jgi:hypothetical protein
MRPVENVLETTLRDLALELKSEGEPPLIRLQTKDSAQYSSVKPGRRTTSTGVKLGGGVVLFGVCSIPSIPIVLRVLGLLGLGVMVLIISWRATRVLRRLISDAWERFLFPTVN